MSPAPAAGSLEVSVRNTFLHFSVGPGGRDDDAALGGKADEEQPALWRNSTEPARLRCIDSDDDESDLSCDRKATQACDKDSELPEQPCIQYAATMDQFEEPASFQTLCPSADAPLAKLCESMACDLGVTDCDSQPCIEHGLTFNPFEDFFFSEHVNKVSLLAVPECISTSSEAMPLHLPQLALSQEQQQQGQQQEDKQYQQMQHEQPQSLQQLQQAHLQLQQLQLQIQLEQLQVEQLQRAGRLHVTSMFQSLFENSCLMPGAFVAPLSQSTPKVGSSDATASQKRQQQQKQSQQQRGGERLASSPAPSSPAALTEGRPGGGTWRFGAKSQCQEKTTIMLRNLPSAITRDLLLEVIDGEGFAARYDFLYLPIDFETRGSTGYAFVNLVNNREAQLFFECFDGYRRWPVAGARPCSTAWSDPHQGLAANVARYRNSPLLHERVPDSYRPVLFSDGVRVPFPLPTKRIKEPRKGNQRMLV